MTGALRSPNAMPFPAKQRICPSAHLDLCLATIPPGVRSGGWDRSIWEVRTPSERSWRASPPTSSCCSEKSSTRGADWARVHRELVRTDVTLKLLHAEYADGCAESGAPSMSYDGGPRGALIAVRDAIYVHTKW